MQSTSPKQSTIQVHCTPVRNCVGQLQCDDEAYEEYCRDYRYRQQLEDENMDVAILAAVLPSLRNLRSVRIEKDMSDTAGDWDDEDCSFPRSRAGQRFVRAFTTSLSVSGLGIEELTLVPSAETLLPC
jgi:hypothetical protein